MNSKSFDSRWLPRPFFIPSLVLLLILGMAGPAGAVDYFGDIRLYAGDTPPDGWMFCHGQTLEIGTYPTLYSLLGNTFGGDGRFTFNLPDFRGRTAMGAEIEGDWWNKNFDSGQTGGTEESDLSQENGPWASSPDGVAARTMPPFLGLNYIICVDGLFPSRR